VRKAVDKFSKTDMRLLTILTICLISVLSHGQTRTVTGRVIGEYEPTPIPGVNIFIRDTIRLGISDLNGNFIIDLPTETNQLTFSFIGMERTSVTIPHDCGNLEIIIMTDVIYDFVTIETINRRRSKRFKKLKEKHREAFDKGTFVTKEPCVTYIYNKY
jgi:hypothetical protein